MSFMKIKGLSEFILEIKNLYYLGKAVLKGTLYILWYKIIRRNVTIKFPFMVYAPVKIVGEGSVFIDRKCSVFYNKHNGLTILTLSKDAKVSIGEGCDLGGLTIRCSTSVTIGDHTMTAFSLIQDVFIINSRSNRNNDKVNPTNNKITIGRNVWLGGQGCVLGGAVIGDGCVLSICSCIRNNKMNDDCLLIGNPVKRGLPIKNLMRIKGNQ